MYILTLTACSLIFLWWTGKKTTHSWLVYILPIKYIIYVSVKSYLIVNTFINLTVLIAYSRDWFCMYKHKTFICTYTCWTLWGFPSHTAFSLSESTCLPWSFKWHLRSCIFWLATFLAWACSAVYVRSDTHMQTISVWDAFCGMIFQAALLAKVLHWLTFSTCKLPCSAKWCTSKYSLCLLTAVDTCQDLQWPLEIKILVQLHFFHIWAPHPGSDFNLPTTFANNLSDCIQRMPAKLQLSFRKENGSLSGLLFFVAYNLAYSLNHCKRFNMSRNPCHWRWHAWYPDFQRKSEIKILGPLIEVF